jgi:O-acetylhomoserine/O-acetylserine sulfhydrylase
VSSFIDGWEVWRLLTNVSSVGDSKTLAIHPWTTTHEQLSDEEKISSGVTEVRFDCLIPYSPKDVN